jgi:hypothetical protein
MANKMTAEDKRKRHFSIFNDLKSEYKVNEWQEKHKDVRDYIYPQGGRFDDDDTLPNDGKRRDDKILDSTASIEHRKLTSIIYSGITSPAIPWVKLTTDDPALKEITAVKAYFDEVTRILLDIYAKSNFYTSAKNTYAEISAFCTSAVQVEPDPDTVLRFIPYTIGEYYIDNDARGIVMTLCREFSMRAKNVVEKFGEENVSDNVKRMVEVPKAGNEWVKIMHIQERNHDRDPTKLDAKNKLYSSTYYEVDTDDKQPPLRESGYDTKRFAVSRWHTVGDEVWGSGPGIMALPDVKELQTIEDDIMEASELGNHPPLLANGSIGKFQIKSGADDITWVDGITSSDQDTVKPLHGRTSDVNALLAIKADLRDRIRAIFFSNLLFLISASDNRNRTATEILEAKREELLLLGPIMEQLHPDHIRPIIESSFDIIQKAGLFPEPPPELAGADIKIEIISLIQLAQRISELTPIEQLAAFVSNLTQVWPEARDKFNADQAIDEAGAALGVRSGVVRSDEEVAAKRDADQAAIQQQQDLLNAQEAINSAKTLSETDTSGDNALTALAAGGAA